MKYFLFIFPLLFILVSCRFEPPAEAELAVSDSSPDIGEEITADASESTYDKIKWFVNDISEPFCHNKNRCLFTFDESGIYTIRIKVTVKGNRWETEDEADETVIVD